MTSDTPSDMLISYRPYGEIEVLDQVLHQSAPFRDFYQANRRRIPGKLDWSVTRTHPHCLLLFGDTGAPMHQVIFLTRVPALPEDAAIVAHEMTHAIFNAEGCAGAYVGKGTSQESTQLAEFLNELTSAPLIAAQLARYGFDVLKHWPRYTPQAYYDLLKSDRQPPTALWLQVASAADILCDAMCYQVVTGDPSFGGVLDLFCETYNDIGEIVYAIYTQMRATGYETVQQRYELLRFILQRYEVSDLTAMMTDVEMFRSSAQTIHATDPTPMFARWPGTAPGQGSQSGEQVSLITENASTFYAECGLWGAMEDGWFVDEDLVGHFAPRVIIRTPGSYDFLDFYGEWIRLPFGTRLRGIDLSVFRFELVRASITYESGTAECEFELQAETFGEPGVEDPQPAPESPGDYNDPIIDFPPYDPTPVDEENYLLYEATDKLTIPNSDGYLYQTSTLRAFSPFFSRFASGVSGTLKGAVQISSLLTRLVLVSTASDGIYTLDDPRGARTLTLRKTFGYTAIRRDVDAPIGGNLVFCLSYYGSTSGHTGHWFCFSTDQGETWSAEVQMPGGHYSTNLDAYLTFWLSSSQPGVAIIGTYSSTGAVPSGVFYVTSGTYASPTLISTPAGYNPNQLTNGIHIPFHNNPTSDIVYYGRYGVSTGLNLSQTWRKQSGSAADISPVKDGYKLRPSGRFAISSGLTNRRYMVMRGNNDPASPANFRSGVFVSEQYGDSGSWTEITTGNTTDYVGLAQAGNNPLLIYAWGGNGAIGVAPNFGASGFIDKRGNIPTDFPSVGTHLKIFGV